MNTEEIQKHIEQLEQSEIKAFFVSDSWPKDWIQVYQSDESAHHHVTRFSALVPPKIIPKLLEQSYSWDFHIGDGRPQIKRPMTNSKGLIYSTFGNDAGIEPIVIYRTFSSIRDPFFELSQEFRLFHNLFEDRSRKRFIIADNSGEESEAVKYNEKCIEIRSDLLITFCSAKKMAIAIYLDSHRYSKYTLHQLAIKESSKMNSSKHFTYLHSISSKTSLSKKRVETSSFIGGKKFLMPRPFIWRETGEDYQKFIIDSDASGSLVYWSCDPDQLANNFGKNPESPHHFTPVYFKREVLNKYYNDPRKYSVKDGCVRCGAFWMLKIDNDRRETVMAYLGDLGRDLPEYERNYWLGFNIKPSGQTISKTAYARDFLAEFADAESPDLHFTREYESFCEDFRALNKRDFFLQLHPDDNHFLTSLRMLSGDNQLEFDSQLIALSKILVDSLNEKEMVRELKTILPEDKGIIKLDKFFTERGITAHERHVEFLRSLQVFRSKSAAHRKGTGYDRLVANLRAEGVGQQEVFELLLKRGIEFIHFLRISLIPVPPT